jgi:hypothetical protein
MMTPPVRLVQPDVGPPPALEFRRKLLRSVMNGEDVNLIVAYEPADDTVRMMNHLADQRIVEFRNGPTGLGERDQPIGRGDEVGDDDDAY